MQPVEDRLAVGRVEVDVAARAGLDRLQHAAGGVVDLQADVGSQHAAAVGHGGVRRRHLDRGGLEVALADREVDVVAHRPRPIRQVLAEEPVAPCRGGQEPAELTGQIDAGWPADAQPVRPLLQCLGPAVVDARTERVEEHVRGHLERLAQGECAVWRAARVLEGDAADLDRAGVVDEGIRRERAALQAGDRSDELERRAGRVLTADRAVEQGRPVGRRRERLVASLGERLGEDVGVKAGRGPERQHLAVTGIHRHEGPASVAQPGDRLLALALEAEVDRELEVLPLEGLAKGQLARRAPERVDLHAAGAVDAAQIAVVAVLDPVLADDGALMDALELEHLQLAGADGPDGSEHVGADVAVRVLAEVDAGDRDPGKLVLALEEVRVEVARSVGLDGRGRVGHERVLAAHLGVDLVRRLADHGAQALVQDAAARTGGRELAGVDLHRDRYAIVDQHGAVAIDDVAARRRDRDVADPVVVRLRPVLVAREDLEEPQAEEDDREHRQRDPTEDRHAQRELRRDGRAALVGQLELEHERLGPGDRAEPAGRVGASTAAARVVGQQGHQQA